jgi:hypothetical protein
MNSAPKKVRICPEAVDAAIWAEACARMAGNALRPVASAQHGTSLPTVPTPRAQVMRRNPTVYQLLRCRHR